ncbi:MAG: hypothetical protein PHE79_04075 [Eubacteriales bacterium]|nr:hypothetical protein [Eubacteriales bacterium]
MIAQNIVFSDNAIIGRNAVLAGQHINTAGVMKEMPRFGVRPSSWAEGFLVMSR